MAERHGFCSFVLPLSYHIDEDEHLITIQGGNEVRFDEVQSLSRDLFGDQRYAARMPQLVDLRTCTLTLPPRSIASLGRFLAQRYSRKVEGPVAVVIDQSLGTRATAVLYRLTSAVKNAELFDDYGFALRWLLKRSSGEEPDPREQRRN